MKLVNAILIWFEFDLTIDDDDTTMTITYFDGPN